MIKKNKRKKRSAGITLQKRRLLQSATCRRASFTTVKYARSLADYARWQRSSPTCWRIICAAFSLIGWRNIARWQTCRRLKPGRCIWTVFCREILPPSTHRLYWRVEDDLTLVRMNTQQVQVQTEVMNAVLQPRRKGAVKGRDAILTVQVPAWHVGVTENRW